MSRAAVLLCLNFFHLQLCCAGLTSAHLREHLRTLLEQADVDVFVHGNFTSAEALDIGKMVTIILLRRGCVFDVGSVRVAFVRLITVTRPSHRCVWHITVFFACLCCVCAIVFVRMLCVAGQGYTQTQAAACFANT